MKRILWLDFMKAFAIFIVVLGHIGHRFGEPHPIYVHFIEMIEMPFFFMLSGIIAHSLQNKRFIVFLRNKCISLLLPFFSCGLIYSLIFNRINDFLFDSYHAGYWFLPSIFTCQLIFITIYKVVGKIATITSYFRLILLISSLLIPYYLAFFAITNLSPSFVQTTSLYNTFYNYFFYILGYVLMEFRVIFSLNKDRLIAISFSCFICGIIYCIYRNTSLIDVPMKMLQILFCFSLTGILYGIYRIQPACICKITDYIGKRTLGIYVFHFFLTPFFVLTPFANYSSGFLLLIGIITTIIVIATCIVAISFIQNNKYLNFILLGTKKLS